MVISIFIGVLFLIILFVVISHLYAHHLRSKRCLTHVYTFTHQDELVYVTSQTKLNDEDILFHKERIAFRFDYSFNTDEIGVMYIGKFPIGKFD